MFDRIAPVYDAMNRVMTAGLDRSWRRLTVEAVVQPGDRVLDACCGTGDLAVAAEREGGVVTGLDFSPGMLERARRKSDTVDLGGGRPARAALRRRRVRRGDRRLRHPERRRPRGRRSRAAPRARGPAGGLRSSRSPSRAGLLRPFFSLWFDRIVPLLGKVLPGGKAYTYLPASVRRFPGAEELAALIERRGSSRSGSACSPATIVALHVGVTE